MPRFAAFLRGINVGAHKVPMADLRDLLGALGCADVATLLNSGNATFTTTRRSADGLERDIAAALEERFGFAVPTLLRDQDDVARIATAAPFGPDAEDRTPDTKLHITFTRGDVTPALQTALADASTDDDRLAGDGREIYWLRAGKLMDATVDIGDVLAEWAADLGDVTMRTAATVRKVRAKLDG